LSPRALPGWSDVRHLARKELADALEALSGRQPIGDRVHEVRTAIKKVRALARLVEPGVGRQARKVDRSLRALAKSVSSLRDAEVLLAAFDRLLQSLSARSDEPPDLPLRVMRAALATRLAHESRALRKNHRADKLEAALRAARGRIGRWRPRRRGHGRELVTEALTEGYRRARKAMTRATADASVTTMHAWRRAVKRHRNQLRVVEDARPKAVGPRMTDLDTLGDQLGEGHDLSLLEAELAPLPPSPARRRLLEAARRRRRQLRAEALLLGRGLFAGKPKAMVRRLLG